MPSGNDRRRELGVGMSAAAKVADNGVNVKRHAAVCDGNGMAAVFEEKPACGRAGAGHPRAAGIERTDTADEPVGGEVGVAADHDIGAASGQHRPEDRAQRHVVSVNVGDDSHPHARKPKRGQAAVRPRGLASALGFSGQPASRGRRR